MNENQEKRDINEACNVLYRKKKETNIFNGAIRMIQIIYKVIHKNVTVSTKLLYLHI